MEIKSAEIELVPLTLFVGDNHGGKSYLMSLLWGIKNLGIKVLIGSESEPNSKIEYELFTWIKEQVSVALNQGSNTVCIGDAANVLQTVLQKKIKIIL